jgi:hypothetical protein
MKKQYKALLWIVLVGCLSYLYLDSKKQETKIAIVDKVEVRQVQQKLVVEKTPKLPAPKVCNYLEVGK